MPRLLIAASGTGGHIYPALSFADSLDSSWEIQWLGVPNRLEISLVPKKYNLTTIKVGGLKGNVLRKMFGLFKLLFASFAVSSLLRKEKINVIFTTGGYISAPSILGAKLTGVPIILHESNAFPGKVTRFFGRFCDHVALGVPLASNYLSGCKTSFTGTPVRPEFYSEQVLPGWVPKGRGELIVIMGGSQGATKLNELVRRIIPALLKKGCRIVHLTGENDNFYRKLTTEKQHPNLVLRHFSNEIPALLQHADLAISRAGASAICELMVSKTPSILIPFPQATDQHQDFNAAYMAKFGGAIIVNQHNPEENILKDVVFRLIGSINLKQMKLNMNTKHDFNPEDKLLEIIYNLI